MATALDILQFIESIAPVELKMDWDNVGLLCGRSDKEVSTILVALDPFPHVCDEAIQVGADLLVTHHPLIFRAPNAVTDVGFLLSVSATAGIITLGSPLASFILKKTAKRPLPVKLLGKALTAMAITVAAIFFTLPFVAWYFGECSLISPLTNLLFTLSAVASVLLRMTCNVCRYR